MHTLTIYCVAAVATVIDHLIQESNILKENAKFNKSESLLRLIIYDLFLGKGDDIKKYLPKIEQ